MTGRRTQARAPHHRAGAAPWGSHGEHGDAPRRTKGALPLTGVYILSAQAKLKGQPKGTAMYQMMGCACKAASRAGQGMLYRISKLFLAVVPIVNTFPSPEDTPHHEGATHRQNVPCRPNATGTTGTNPTRPPRPIASDNRTGRPLGGEDGGQPNKLLTTTQQPHTWTRRNRANHNKTRPTANK